MPHVIRILCMANGEESPHDGQYVRRYNPNTAFGELALSSTDDIAQALRFDTMEEVLRARQLVSEVEPTRPDGQPNRPISGLTLEVVTVR